MTVPFDGPSYTATAAMGTAPGPFSRYATPRPVTSKLRVFTLAPGSTSASVAAMIGAIELSAEANTRSPSLRM